jgi:NAD(P)-dependent dehydrogenase (short-subunit alcohol dehydrogenase family)
MGTVNISANGTSFAFMSPDYFGAAEMAGGKKTAKGKRRAPDPMLQRQRSYARPPMPRQHQDSPGLESDVRPRPKYQAPEYRPAGKLEGKVALITGGDSGIGRAVAVMYAREGADVSIVYLSEEESDAIETKEAIEEYDQRAVLIAGDVTSSDFCREAVEQTVSQLGKLDILVNNAAFQMNQDSIEEVTEEQWEKTFRTNIFGYFYMVKAAMPHLRAGSCIINTGSITGFEGEATLLDYASTKGAIHAFTKSLAQNLVEKKIRVNAVAPGPVWTPLNTAAKNATDVSQFGAWTPMGRPGQPEEIAPTYVFLASNADSSFITGEIISLLGGDVTAA